MMERMPDEQKKPDPIKDLRDGLGLLFRAAKTAVDEFPTGKIEEAVKEGAREVGRALETVGDVIDEKVLGNKKPKPPVAEGTPPAQAQSQTQTGATENPPAEPPKDSAEPKGDGS